jgi:hypothetical protein
MKHLANVNQIWYKHFLHDGNSVYSNEGPNPLQKGDNLKSAKIG